jgi:hypothetical protein
LQNSPFGYLIRQLENSAQEADPWQHLRWHLTGPEAELDFPVLKEVVPNITPDKETSIGTWKREEIADLLISGTKPDLDYVRGLMYDAIQGTSHGYRNMNREDVLAIADYIKSIPAIKNKVK